MVSGGARGGGFTVCRYGPGPDLLRRCNMYYFRDIHGQIASPELTLKSVLEVLILYSE